MVILDGARTVFGGMTHGRLTAGISIAVWDRATGREGDVTTDQQRLAGGRNMSTKDARNTVVVTHDPEDRKGRLKRLGGSQSDHWNNVLANQTANTLWLSKDAETRRRQYGAMSAALRGIEPKDEVEGMIAAQLVAAHNAAMECYRRAMVSEQTFEGRRENLSQANKLSRTYAVLLDALNRHRGKGQQKVTVEHVHVHSGGQAIVGAVESSRGSATTKPESGNPYNARQITHAPQPALPSKNAEPELVSSACDAERPMSDARRNVAGSTEGK